MHRRLRLALLCLAAGGVAWSSAIAFASPSGQTPRGAAATAGGAAGTPAAHGAGHAVTVNAGSVAAGSRAAKAPVPCADERLTGGTWPRYGHDAFNTRTQPDETSLNPTATGGIAPAWVFSLSAHGDSGQLQSTPIAADGCVFIASSDGVVYAVDAVTGALIWRHTLSAVTTGLGGAIVGAPALDHGRLIVLVDQQGDGTHGPYVAALNEHTGAPLWTAAPITTASGYYTNGAPQVFDGVLFAGFSPAEGNPAGQGGFALYDAATGALLRVTDTISAADQAAGFAGGGIWSTPAYDAATGYAYVGSGNPYSKAVEDVHTNAILKIDLRRSRPTFGQIVASYKGNVDQYTQALQTLSQTPVCAASATAPDPLDDPACGQLDLDFGAAPNLFRTDGHLVVGDLQKSGVYHVADAASMAPVWSTIVGASCQVCNAASTAVSPEGVFGEGVPGGLEFSLDPATGSRTWTTPVGDGVHYQSTSEANGVVYTTDMAGFLDAFDAASGMLLMRRPLTEDTSAQSGALSSSGIAIAYHTLYVASSGETSSTGEGFLIAYRAA